jgi:hypothetical protein
MRDASMALTRLWPALVLASAATAAQSVPQGGPGANIVELAAVRLEFQILSLNPGEGCKNQVSRSGHSAQRKGSFRRRHIE